MIYRHILRYPHLVFSSALLRGAFVLATCLALHAGTAWCQAHAETPAASLPVHVTHVLGFENVPRDVRGELLTQGSTLRFQRNGRSTAEIRIDSITKIFVGEEDRQLGGMPMTVGKAAAPYGAGRVVSLFAHKKYDTVALEYHDISGGLHAAIFRLEKGEGEIFEMGLVALGAGATTHSEGGTSIQGERHQSLLSGKWSVQLASIDPGDTAIDPCFSAAIYENTLQKLSSSREFDGVFRSGDQHANVSSNLLLLKLRAEKYSAGSETRRAVTTIGGATKLKVRVQVVTSDGQILLEHTVDGNVRLYGDNLKATSTVADRTARLLKNSNLPQIPRSTQEARVQEGDVR